MSIMLGICSDAILNLCHKVSRCIHESANAQWGNIYEKLIAEIIFDVVGKDHCCFSVKIVTGEVGKDSKLIDRI